jgi:hypothetical protein
MKSWRCSSCTRAHARTHAHQYIIAHAPTDRKHSGMGPGQQQQLRQIVGDVVVGNSGVVPRSLHKIILGDGYKGRRGLMHSNTDLCVGEGVATTKGSVEVIHGAVKAKRLASIRPLIVGVQRR